MPKNEVTYRINLDAEISQLNAKLEQIKKSMGGVLATNKGSGLQKSIDQITKAIELLQEKANTPIKNASAFASMEKEIAKIITGAKIMADKLDDLSKLSGKEKISFLPESEQKRINDFIQASEQYRKKIIEINKATKELIEAQKERKRAEDAVTSTQGKIKGKQEELSALKRSQSGTQGAITKTKNSLKAAQDAGDTEAVEKYEQKLKTLNEQAEETAEAIKKIETSIKTLTTNLNGQQAVLDKAKENYDKISQSFDETKAKQGADAYREFSQAAAVAGQEINDINWEDTEENLNRIANAAQSCINEGIKPLDTNFQSAANTTRQLNDAGRDLIPTVEKEEQSFKQLDEQVGKVNSFATRIKQFVGWTGAAIAFRRVTQDAIATIKDLDAQMTEMAVVTDLGVGDYWKQLPEYTKRANELGVSIKSAYEAATLYYQQGLKTNEVVEVSNSTLKMARIAGLNAAEATDKMTAALRGFNMEVTQTNADRVADVYSKLAAITASNVNEISTAMTKTASIASNANMEFETTAAFLSQIIETTRESAETAGTALKTVIARFQELKKDPSEIGEVDGEIVDANKIETALRSVGVASRDTSGQFRDLDDVLMELASKWDALDTNTQRYIATIAAGSRQQSRFIAMMSNYSRTTELVSAANNAAGASNMQFQKTLESLESKTEQLKNAWHEFTMGLVNNDIVKFGIDILTNLLKFINKITEGIDSLSGTVNSLSSSAMKIGLVITAFWAGDKALKIFMGTFKGTNSVFASFGKILSTAGLNLKNFAVGFVSLFQTSASATKSLNRFTMSLYKNTQERIIATEAQEKYNIIEKKYKDLLAKTNAQEEVSLKDKMQLDAMEKELALAKTNNIKASAAYAASLGFSEAQQAEYSRMVGLGISMETAAIMTKMGLTSATVERIGAEQAEIFVTELSTKSGLRKTIAIKAENLATKLSTKGVIGKTVATKLDAVATAAATGTTAAFASAIWSLLWPLLLVVAAIGALVGAIIGIIAIIKKAKKESPEGQLKSAQEGLQKVSEAANDAADAYKGLTSSLSDLNDKYEALNDLTVGTNAWKESVAEINNEVLDLIDKYPELRKEVDNVNGVLTINEKAQQKAIDAAFQRQQALASAVTAQKITVNQKQQAVDYQNLSGKAKLGNNKTQGKQLQSQTEQLAMAMASGELTDTSKEGIEKYLKDVLQMDQAGVEKWAKEASESADELKKFGESVMAATQANKIYYDSMATNALASSAAFSEATEENQAVLSNILDGSLFSTKYEAEKNKINSYGKEEFSSTEVKNEIKKIYGETATINNKGQVTYTKDGESVTLEAEEVKASLASARASNELTSKIDDVNKITAEQSGLVQKALQKKDASNLSSKDIQKLSQESLKVISGVDQQVMAQMELLFKEIADSADRNLREATKTLDNRMTKTVSFYEELSINSIKGLSSHYEQVLTISGEGAVNAINDQLTNALKGYSEENRDIIISQLNAIDWTDATQLENFGDTLKELGVSMSTNLDLLITEIGAQANAVHKISWEDLIERIKKLGQTLADIRSGEQGRTFGEDVYKELIKADSSLKNQFVQDVSGQFVYVGSKMSILTDAIENNTKALLKEKSELLSTQAQVSDFSGLDESKQIKDLSDGEALTNWFNDFINEAIRKGVDLKNLQIENLGNSFGDIATLSTEKMAELYKEINSSISQFSKEGFNDYTQLASTQYTANTREENIGKIMTISKVSDKTDLDKADLEAYINATLAQAIQDGFTSAQKDSLEKELRAAFEGEITEASDLMKRFMIGPWNDTFGKISQYGAKIEELNNKVDYWDDKYQELVDDENASIAELQDALLNRASALKELNFYSSQAKQAAQEELDNYIQGLDYIDTIADEETGVVSLKIDYSKINGENRGEATTIIEKANSLLEQVNSYEQQTRSIRKKTDKSVEDLVKKTRDALINQQQKLIDNQEKLNDTITSFKNEIVSAIREQIEAERQARDMEDTTKELQDKEARLAYLQASGGSETEILSLQKELQKDYQSYQDTLVDQQLDAMEKANEKAEQQRETQIRIAQDSFDYWSSNQAWTDAKEKVDAAIQDPNGATAKELSDLLTDEQSSTYISNMLSSLKKTMEETGLLTDANNGVGLDTKQYNDEIVTYQVEPIVDALYESQGKINEKKIEDVTVKESIGKDISTVAGATSVYQDLSTMDTSSLNEYDKQVRDTRMKDAQTIGMSRIRSSVTNTEDNTYKDKQAALDAVMGLGFEKDGIEYNEIATAWDKRSEDKGAANHSNLLSQIQNAQNITRLKQLKEQIKSEDGDLIAAYGERSRELSKFTYSSGTIGGAWGGDIFTLNSPDNEKRQMRSKDFSAGGEKDIETGAENFGKGQLFKDRSGNWQVALGNGKQVAIDTNYIWDRDRRNIEGTLYDLSMSDGWKKWFKYKQGGFADFTGPAWLDGTPSAPEAVLNATDTKNFIALRDLLSEFMKSGSITNNTENQGDIYVDVDINVDKVEGDYDVDDIASRVQENIVKSANYRNVNHVSNTK